MTNMTAFFRKTALSVCALGALSAFTAAPALANDDDPAQYKGQIITMEEAVKIAETHVGGTASSSEFDANDDDKADNPVYEIDVTKDGVQHDVKVNAKDGTVIENKIDN